MSIDTTTIILGSLIVGLVVGNFFYEASAEHHIVANEVANGVVNNTANRVTTIETEVYRVVCVEEKSGYCGAYSVRRIVKE